MANITEHNTKHKRKSYYYYLDTFIVWFVDISLTIDIIAQGDMGELIVLLLGISATIGSIICAYRFSKWLFAFDEFAITSKRVIAKVGVIRRIAFELQNEQIESIEIHQGIIGRILNYGTLMPCGIGASKVRIPFVVSPFEFRQYFYDLKKPQNS